MARPPAPARRPFRRRHPLLALAMVVAYLVLVAGAGVAAGRIVVDPIATIDVTVRTVDHDRHVVAAPGEPLLSVLTTAGVVPRDGRLLAAVSGRVLDPAVDPATFEVDGRPADADTRVRDGQVVEVVDGTDVVERTRQVLGEIPPPPMPDVLRHVHRRGRAGQGEKVVGERSGEVVSTRVVVPAVAPARVPGKVVALTFDDGPTTTWTPLVLAVLEQKGVHATFCEVGEMVGYHPEVSRQVVDQGHQLCNHTLSHDVGLRQADQPRLDEQIGGGAEAMTSRGLPAPAYYRPPGGYLSDAIVATAHRQGEEVISWKVDPEDWATDANAFSIVAAVLEQVEPGAIILLHDGGGRDRIDTVLALGAIIDQLRAQGYSFTFPVLPAGG